MPHPVFETFSDVVTMYNENKTGNLTTCDATTTQHKNIRRSSCEVPSVFVRL